MKLASGGGGNQNSIKISIFKISPHDAGIFRIKHLLMKNITQLGITMQHMWQFIEMKISTISRTTLLYGKTGSLLVVLLVVHTLSY